MDDDQAKILRAIRNYFNDRSRSASETRAGLKTIAEELDILIDSIPRDIADADGS